MLKCFQMLVGALLLGAPAHAQLRLAACGVEGVAARCGAFEVLEDRAQPSGRRIALRVVILPPRISGPSQDPLFILDGGPGSAATGLAGFVVDALAPVREHRAIVLVDQRGTGGSNPLTCETAPQHFVVPLNTAGCLKRLTSHADLHNYGTLDFVRDLDDLRNALGFDRVHLYGASYGSRVAQLYLREYPHAVRSIVMAGPAPMNMIVPDGIAEGSQHALRQIIGGCRSNAACAGAFPALVMPPGSFDDFTTVGIHMLMYAPETARRIPWLLAQAAAGRTRVMQREINGARERLAGAIALGLHLTVLCSEDVPFAKASTGALAQEYREACGGWPRIQAPPGLHETVRSAVPVLLLTGEYDPVTGPKRVKEMTRYFSNGRIVVVHGGAHMFGGFTGCLDQAIATFLDGASPDFSCLAKLPQPDYFLGR